MSTKSLEVGTRVTVSGGKPGVIKFIGETEFAAGEWIGVSPAPVPPWYEIACNITPLGGARHAGREERRISE